MVAHINRPSDASCGSTELQNDTIDEDFVSCMRTDETTKFSCQYSTETMPSRVDLPENVSIYAASNSEGLLGAKLLTRLVTTAPDIGKLSEALASNPDFASFCHQHGKSILIFDGDDQDVHHEHFRQVCLCLKDNGDIGLEFGQCVFDASTALEAGFQTDRLDSGAVMLVDLRHGEEDDSSESETGEQ